MTITQKQIDLIAKAQDDAELAFAALANIAHEYEAKRKEAAAKLSQAQAKLAAAIATLGAL